MCDISEDKERYGLYAGEYECLTHKGYTINGYCPREDEPVDINSVEGLARVIDPYAFPTDKQIEIHSVCYTGWPVEQMVMRCRMDYEKRQRFAIEAAERIMVARGITL